MNPNEFDDDEELINETIQDEEYDEEVERRRYQEEYEAPISMETLGLSWKDFF